MERLNGYITPERICFECRREYSWMGKSTPCDSCNNKPEDDDE